MTAVRKAREIVSVGDKNNTLNEKLDGCQYCFRNDRFFCGDVVVVAIHNFFI